jgi:hypothetical protein
MAERPRDDQPRRLRWDLFRAAIRLRYGVSVAARGPDAAFGRRRLDPVSRGAGRRAFTVATENINQGHGTCED